MNASVLVGGKSGMILVKSMGENNERRCMVRMMQNIWDENDEDL